MNPRSLLLFCLTCILAKCEPPTSTAAGGGGYRIFRKIYDQCTSKPDSIKCFKIQALKVADRALHSRSINLVDGVSLVGDERVGREFQVQLNESKLERLDSGQLDDLLADTAARFVDSRRLQVSMPRLLEEGRKRRKQKHHGAALLWALAIKGSFLAMAYKGIAVMAGTALIVGKMALLLSAILGLKKLVSSGQDKTTFEIVKHPKYSETHTHSSSYEDDGHYRRSLDSTEEFGMKNTAYRGHNRLI